MALNEILIWDGDGLPPEDTRLIVLWSNYDLSDDNDIISIPDIVEREADKLRERFLTWVYELGETRLPDIPLVEILKIRQGFSYWWMTLIAEKCNWAKSPYISSVVRLFVLEEIIESHVPEQVTFVSDNKNLARIIKDLCLANGIAFTWSKTDHSCEEKSLRKKISDLIPVVLQGGMFAVRYVWERRKLLFSKRCASREFKNDITLVDYFINFNSNLFDKGKYSSNYWTGLPELMSKLSIRANWLHLFVPQSTIQTPKDACSSINRFRKISAGGDNHSLVDEWLSSSVVVHVLYDYFRLIYKYVCCRYRLVKVFKPSHSKLNLWPLYKHDFHESMCGHTAVWNCINLNLFEAALSSIPHQRFGMYLQENQGWELAFIYAWKNSGHGRLIGVPHSTVRFWDLRYFFDKRLFVNTEYNPLPKPDAVAVNGPVAKQAFEDSQYPMDQVYDVEALRYLYLRECSNEPVKNTISPSVLICGDYLADTNIKMMKMVCEAAESLPEDVCFWVKPHPACPIKREDYPDINLKMTNDPLTEIFGYCDIVFTSNITSAAVDAYCANKHIISLLDGAALNMSPLRELGMGIYVSNAGELKDAIGELIINRDLSAASYSDNYFWLNPDLPRWQMVLKNAAFPQSDIESSVQ